jgi:predicted lipoprotein with Yx(FWY)xxD motif
VNAISDRHHDRRHPWRETSLARRISHTGSLESRKTLLRNALAAMLALIPFVGCAGAPIPTGGVLTDTDGYTLYTFDYDEHNKSNCNASCINRWTPWRATQSDRSFGRFSIVIRANGDRQWAIDARPLYRFNGDLQPGDAFGERLGWPWRAVHGYPRPSLLDRPVSAARERTRLPGRAALGEDPAPNTRSSMSNTS